MLQTEGACTCIRVDIIKLAPFLYIACHVSSCLNVATRTLAPKPDTSSDTQYLSSRVWVFDAQEEATDSIELR